MSWPEGAFTAEESKQPSRLYFQHGSEICHCMIVRKVESGAVICIPRGGIPPEVLAEAEESDYAGIIGPFSEMVVRAVTAAGSASPRDLEILLVDLDVAGFDGILAAVPPGTDASAIKEFGRRRGSAEWPHGPMLLELCKQFVGSATEDSRPTSLQTSWVQAL